MRDLYYPAPGSKGCIYYAVATLWQKKEPHESDLFRFHAVLFVSGYSADPGCK